MEEPLKYHWKGMPKIVENFDNKAQKPSRLAQLFEGFDYEAYWDEWDREHPGESKELDWGGPVGKEEF